MAVELSTWDAQGTPTTPTFSTMRFPAGEAHVKVRDDADAGATTEIATLRGTSGDDLVLLGMWADAVRQRGARSVALVPYLPGARQDRGLPFGAKVYADVLNGFAIDQVIAFDPHSPVIVGLVERLTVWSRASRSCTTRSSPGPNTAASSLPTRARSPGRRSSPRPPDSPCSVPRSTATRTPASSTGSRASRSPRPVGCSSSTTSATAAAPSWVSPRDRPAEGTPGPLGLARRLLRPGPAARRPLRRDRHHRLVPSTAAHRRSAHRRAQPVPHEGDPMTTTTGLEPRTTTASPIAPLLASTATSTRTGRSTRRARPGS